MHRQGAERLSGGRRWETGNGAPKMAQAERPRVAAAAEKQVQSGSVGRILSAGCPARRSFLWAAGYPTALATYPHARADRPARPGGRIACLFGVAPGGVWRAAGVAIGAVSSYLTISPLPALTGLGGIFLFHFPSPWALRLIAPGR